MDDLPSKPVQLTSGRPSRQLSILRLHRYRPCQYSRQRQDLDIPRRCRGCRPPGCTSERIRSVHAPTFGELSDVRWCDVVAPCGCPSRWCIPWILVRCVRARCALCSHGELLNNFSGDCRVYNPDPGLGMRPGAMKIVHYTSTDMKHWEFAEIARGDPVAYDSDVFKVGATAGLPDVRVDADSLTGCC